MLGKTCHIIRVSEFHSVWLWRKIPISIIFLQDADFAVLFHSILMYKKMGKTFFVRDPDRLFQVWSHVIEIIPLSEQDSTKPCVGRAPMESSGQGPSLFDWLPITWNRKMSYFLLPLLDQKQMELQEAKAAKLLTSEGTSVCKIQARYCQKLTDIIKEGIIFYLPLDNTKTGF